jgi:hypothetical protein
LSAADNKKTDQKKQKGVTNSKLMVFSPAHCHIFLAGKFYYPNVSLKYNTPLRKKIKKNWSSRPVSLE